VRQRDQEEERDQEERDQEERVQERDQAMSQTVCDECEGDETDHRIWSDSIALVNNMTSLSLSLSLSVSLSLSRSLSLSLSLKLLFSGRRADHSK
jgi:hypothetical protein